MWTEKNQYKMEPCLIEAYLSFHKGVRRFNYLVWFFERRPFKMNKLKFLALSLVMVVALSISGPSSVVFAQPLSAASAPGLGAAASFSVLGFSEVTNTNATTLSGDVGVWSGSLISGLSDIVVGGAVHQTDTVAQQAQADASAAFDHLAGQASSGSLGALDSLTVVPGVYDLGAGSLSGGVLTLDGEGVYIFRTTSDLTSSGSIALIGGARGCDVYWQVASQANLVGGSFVGTIIAGSGIVFGSGVSLEGRALAIGGNVTLIGNNIYGPGCSSGPESESTPAIVVPATGGAPIRNMDFSWVLVILGGVSIAAVVWFTQEHRRTHLPKK
jgi:hypothetical protein